MEERTNRRKIKLVRMLEILRQETDEQHPLTTRQLCARLAEEGIPCDRKVLYQDISLLNEQGFEVMTVRKGHDMAYYVDDRSFSVPELRILLDAVQAASFITEKKTEELTEKIAALAGSSRAEILKGSLVCFNTRKHSNEAVYYIVGFLEEAIRDRKKASFCYFDLDENGERVFRKKHARYVVEPLALIFNSDTYYLICYDGKNRDKKATYRIDRMDQVQEEKEDISEEGRAALDMSDFAEYTKQVFTMFAGQEETVTLRFDRSLINPVLDKFGEATRMTDAGDGSLTAKVRVQVSPAFFGWVAQFGDKMRIGSPKRIAEQYKKHIRTAEG